METKMELNPELLYVEPNPYIEYHENGIKFRELWCFNDILHKVDGPAYQSWYDSSQLYKEEWYLNGKIHRAELPAVRTWNYIGKKITEYWYINGKHIISKDAATYKEWLIENNLIGKQYNFWTDEEKILWRLTWS